MKDEARRDLAPLLLLAALTALFFWPVWLLGYRFPLGGGDLYGQLLPIWDYVARWLRHGIFPLWDTQVMAGDPILSEAQYGLLNPLNWPLFLLSPIPERLPLLRVAFSFWLAATGLYLYLRRSPHWRLGREAALTGAMAYAFSQPFVIHLGHPHILDVMAWLPWLLWGMDGAMRRSTAILPAALALTMLLLGGHGQAILYALMVATAYGLYFGAMERHPLRSWARLALVALLGGALAMPVILPALERMPMTLRAIVPADQRHGYEFQPQMWLDFLNPDFHGQGWRFWAPWERVESGYVGASALALAVLGVMGGLTARRRRAGVAFLLGLIPLALLFALGWHGPLYPRLAHLPFFDATWKTGRILYVVSFALAGLAAVGVDEVIRRRAPATLWACLVAIAGFSLLAAAPHFAQAAPDATTQQAALQALRFAALMLLITATLGAAGRGRFGAGARQALLLLIAAELIAVGALAETEAPVPAQPHPGALAFLQADPGWFRVDIDLAALNRWTVAELLREGFEVPQGTGDPMEVFLYDQFYWSIPRKDSPAYRLLGIKYIVMPKGAMPGGADIWPVYTDDPTVELHLNTKALPRAWLVYRTEVVGTFEAARALVFDPAFDPATVAVLEEGPHLEGEGRGTIGVAAYTPNRILFDVESDREALLVLSDLAYPGWEARIDGEPAHILRTDTIFRGLLVPPGSHRVEMRYAPRSFRFGLTAAAMALLLLGYAARRRREVRR